MMKKRGLLLIGLGLVIFSSLVTAINWEELNLNEDTVASMGRFADGAVGVCGCQHGEADECWMDEPDGLYDPNAAGIKITGASTNRGADGLSMIDWWPSDASSAIGTDSSKTPFDYNWDTLDMFLWNDPGDKNIEVVGITVQEGYGFDGNEYNVPPEKGGCWFALEEHDASTDNSCGVARVKEGYIIDANWRLLCYDGLDDEFWDSTPFCYDLYQVHSGGSDCDNGDEDDALDGLSGAYFRADEGAQKIYLCGDSGMWHICDIDSQQGTLTWSGNYLYNCTMDDTESFAKWDELDLDYDGDGYLEGDNDCANIPFGIESGEEERKLEEGVNQLQTAGCPEHGHPEECDLTTTRCAICINPGAPETCGDEFNNDCDGGVNNLNDLDGETPDNCDYFQAGCEQKTLAELTGEDETDEKSNIQHFNLQNEEYDWLETKDGGYCCGHEGIKDFGEIVTGEDDNSEKICLNKDEHLLGYEEESNFPQWGASAESGEGGGGSGDCKDWCWLDVGGNNAYRIMTIKNPDQQPYDVVSDGIYWQVCNSSDNEGYIDDTNVKLGKLGKKMVHHFYCYQEGKHWSWAECYGEGDYSYNPNIKGRLAGDSLYSLYLEGAKDSADKSVTVTGLIISSEKGNYQKFYQTGELDDKPSYDFSGYDQLEFFIQFVDDNGKELTMDSIKKPFDLWLKLHGPETDFLEQNIFFQQSVLGYAVNSNFFLEGAWTHIVLPIPDNMYTVSYLEFTVNELTKNEVKIKNMFLSRSNDPDPPICSGKDDPDRYSWLTSFDDGETSGYVNAEQMCKEHYGDNAWLGDNDVIEEDENQKYHCCGDDKEEYFLGVFAEDVFS